MTSKVANALRLVPRKIVICAYEDVNLMDISGPLQAFSDSRFVNGRPAYQVTLASEMGGPIVTDSGVKVETVRLDRAVLGSVDTLLVAGGNQAILCRDRSVASQVGQIFGPPAPTRVHLHRGIRSRRAWSPRSPRSDNALGLLRAARARVSDHHRQARRDFCHLGPYLDICRGLCGD